MQKKALNKPKDVISWFLHHIKDDGVPYRLDINQAKIILDSHKNTLVTARAGSGKTRTVVAKIIFLLAYERYQPKEIIAFAFNKKAKTEINERLLKITFDDASIFSSKPQIATTFHAFAYQLLGGRKVLGDKLVNEECSNNIIFKAVKQYEPELAKKLNSDIETERQEAEELFNQSVTQAMQFIARAEQKFFSNYGKLQHQITGSEIIAHHTCLKALEFYHKELEKRGLINFNQLIALASEKLKRRGNTPFKYIFVDEYQDFSLLFLTLIKSLRTTCPKAHLLSVGDDWQAINRFAGSDVEYFLHFSDYFPEDSARLFIPTNYRSGKKIVKNANFFMSQIIGDYKGCKSGNKTKSNIYVKNVKYGIKARSDLPLLLENYFETAARIIRDNPGKTVKILHRNNELSFSGWSIERFVEYLRTIVIDQGIMTATQAECLISESTIHRSKGLESDVVILLEIDAEKFPSKDKSHGFYRIFGDDEETLFADEARLFYVALTRPKEKLYILSKTTVITKEKRKYNFLSYLNDEWLEEL